MKQLVVKFWVAVRRNPVINAFLLAIVTQFAHDVLADQVDWTNIAGYVSLLFLGVAARELTVPAKDNKEVKESVSKAIVSLEKQSHEKLKEWSLRMGVVPIEWHDEAVLKATKDAEKLTRATVESELMDPHFKKGGYID